MFNSLGQLGVERRRFVAQKFVVLAVDDLEVAAVRVQLGIWNM